MPVTAAGRLHFGCPKGKGGAAMAAPIPAAFNAKNEKGRFPVDSL
jgi:hypothetical protein